MKLKKAALIAMMAAIFGGGWVQTAFADDWISSVLEAAPDDFIKSRSYVGVLGTSVFIDGYNEFNGTASVITLPRPIQTSPVSIYSYGEVDIVPAIDRSFGFGFVAGHREGAFAMEFSYWRSLHTATWTDASGSTFFPFATYTSQSVLSSINLDLKRYLLTKLPTQPFFGIGLNFPWLTTKGASSLYDFNQQPVPPVGIDDSTISGLGLNILAGLEIYLGDGFSISGSAIYRFTVWDQINGANEKSGSIYFGGDPEITGNFEGNGLNFCVGTSFGFE